MSLEQENIAVKIGSLIKSKRKSKKLTQKDLSVLMCGNSDLHTLISRVENGAHEGVPLNKINSILLALGIDLINLITNTK